MKFVEGKYYRYRTGKRIRVMSFMERTGLMVISDDDGKIYVLDPKNENEKDWKEVKE